MASDRNLKDLFLAIEARIIAKAPEFKTIEPYNNQFELTEEGKTHDCLKPAVFIEFLNDRDWKKLGDDTYIIDPLIVRFHIMQEHYDAQDGHLNRNLDSYDLEDKLLYGVHMFEPEGAVPFTKTSDATDTDQTNINHPYMDFTTNYIKVIPNDDITVEPDLIITPTVL
jgi:hypothetical protein